MKKTPFLLSAVLLLLVCLSSGCTTYRTNGKIQFDSIHLSGEKPVIHVGKIQETPDQLILLGWVDAKVTQPNWFSAAPSEEMANIILAEKGAALGADAIIYVTYSTSTNTLLNKRLEARGQAVRLKGAHHKKVLSPISHNETVPATAADNTTTTATAETMQADMTKTQEAATDNTTNTVETTDMAATPSSPETAETSSVFIPDSELPTTVEEVTKIKNPEAKKNAPPVSLAKTVIQQEKEQQEKRLAELEQKARECKSDVNDMHDYESKLEATGFMLMNAEFLLRKAKAQKDEDMRSAAIRLVNMLEHQLDQIKAEKPAK